MWQERAAQRYRIGLDLADLELRDALAEALAADASLDVAEPGAAADAVVTDHAEAGRAACRSMPSPS